MTWFCEIYPAISLNGASARILNGPGTKSRLFEGPETFLAPLNGTSDSEGHFGAKKVEKEIYRNLERAIYTSPVHKKWYFVRCGYSETGLVIVTYEYIGTIHGPKTTGTRVDFLKWAHFNLWKNTKRTCLANTRRRQQLSTTITPTFQPIYVHTYISKDYRLPAIAITGKKKQVKSKIATRRRSLHRVAT